MTAFQRKIGAKRVDLRTTLKVGGPENVILRELGRMLDDMSTSAKKAYVKMDDERLNRAQLMLEELGELLHSLADNNEVLIVDAIADLLYVTYGTATTFDLPAETALMEAHRSNMTKGDVRHAEGFKGKDAMYSPPRFARILQEHRS